MKVLVVDDSKSIRMLIGAHVQNEGHEALTAKNGHDAIQLFQHHPIDLVVLGVEMPNMNGFELTRAIRKINPKEWVPIIFLSSNNDDDNLAEGLECGGDVYLTKPVNQVQLRGQILAMARICEMRDRLKEREARMRAILESAHDSIMTVDRSGNILSANSAAEFMFHYESGHMIGRNMCFLLPSELSSETEVYPRLSGLSRDVRKEISATTFYGEAFPAEIAVSEVRVNNTTFFTILLTDITERKNAQAQLQQQNAELEAKQRLLDEEAELAKEVFEKITQYNVDSAHLEVFLASMSYFNGDILLSHERDGILTIFLGDLTGHGLPAAIGAIPLADTFKSHVAECDAKGLFTAINVKLCEALPINRFCCAVLLQWDVQRAVVSVLNAALPHVLVTQEDGAIKQKLPSAYPPLGISPGLVYEPTEVGVTPGDHLFVYTDGINETENAEQEMFGIARVEEAFDGQHPAANMLSHLLDLLAIFKGQAEQSDDLSIFHLSIAALTECEPLG